MTIGILGNYNESKNLLGLNYYVLQTREYSWIHRLGQQGRGRGDPALAGYGVLRERKSLRFPIQVKGEGQDHIKD